MRIAMIGAGYVGLVSGTCLADFGHAVTCIDKDPAKIEQLHRREMPIFEPGLDTLVKENVAAQRLSFTTDGTQAIRDAEAIFIAVGTPSRRGDGQADLSYVFAAIEELAPLVAPSAVIVVKSTVPVGTGDAVEARIRELRPEAVIRVVSNPEFLREGAAIEDFKRPDRIVVGTTDDYARRVLREIYRPLFLNETPILFTDRNTSELTKYAANAFLAMKVTFINEIADLCEAVQCNVQDLARGIGLDKRISPYFLHPGPGFGGSCFPKDTRALSRIGNDAGVSLSLVEATVASNANRRSTMVAKIVRALGEPSEKAIAVLGLTFKPKTDDMRESPSLEILPALSAKGAKLCAYDPEGMVEAAKLIPGLRLASDPYEAAYGADCVLIMTEWDQFRAMDFDRLKKAMHGNLVVDLRNIYEPSDMARKGFRYVSLGRGNGTAPGVVPLTSRSDVLPLI